MYMDIFTRSTMKLMDAMQNAMVAILKHAKDDGESDENYYRRRGKIVAQTSRMMGRSSILHREFSKSWHEHCLRIMSDCGWIRPLFTKSAEWWRARRLDSGSTSSWAGRTRTHVGRSGVSKKWVECIDALE